MAAMKDTSGPHTPPTSGSSELKGARILLVEDSWHVGNAIKRLLRALGADVAGPAATIADAERLIAERKPNVAIVDINLRDGEQANPLLDRLQEESIPVIVITGYTEVSLQPGKVEAIFKSLSASNSSWPSCARSLLGCRIDKRSSHARPPICLRGISIVQDTPSDGNARSTVPPSS
jgi:CheY-like chemotaxis protein